MPLNSTLIEDIFVNRDEKNQKLQSQILNLNMQYDYNEKTIISIINKLISDAKHRKQGFEYLNNILKNCSSEVVSANALNWANLCTIKFSNDVLRELRLKVLDSVIEIAHNDSDFNKKFTSEYLSKLLDICLTTTFVKIFECVAALKTLTTAIKYYSSWFGPHKEKIESYILFSLDSDNSEMVFRAAIAFHYLQQIGGGGVNNINYKTNFTQSFQKLCDTIHQFYDNLFQNDKQLYYEKKAYQDTFHFHEDPALTTQTQLLLNTRRIQNLLVFIQVMIKNKFPAPKETAPKELLDVIARGVSIHKCITSDKTESILVHTFSLLLIDIQTSLYKLLRLYLIWHQTNILPFSYVISKIIVDGLQMSQNCDCFKVDSSHCESVYKTFREWVILAKNSFHSDFQNQLVECILKDITPIQNQVTLTISEVGAGKKSEKAKRRAMLDKMISSKNPANISTTMYKTRNEENNCQFALKSLKVLLENTCLNIKQNLLKDMFKSIFASLKIIHSTKLVHPYTNIYCQMHLYEVLVALFHQNNLNDLPPLHTTLDYLSRGSNHKCRLIADVCQRGIRALEVLCQPICPSLYLGSSHLQPLIEEDVSSVATGNEGNIQIEDVPIDQVSLEDNDFDASTDEFPSRLEDMEKGSEDKSVDATEGHLAKKTSSEETLQVEEIQTNLDATITVESSSQPIVTAPSEDGNEILEGSLLVEEDEPSPALINKVLQKDENAAKFDILKEIDDILQKPNSTEGGNEQSDKTNKRVNEENEVVTPPSKKTKMDEEEDMGDVFTEDYEVKEEKLETNFQEDELVKLDDSPVDSNFLEDHSFVDEVKDY